MKRLNVEKLSGLIREHAQTELREQKICGKDKRIQAKALICFINSSPMSYKKQR